MADRISHEALVDGQFGARARAYLESSVHSGGPDLAAIGELVVGRKYTAALDLGCGGGHVSFAVAPHVASVVALDLSDKMLSAVAASARERGLSNIETVSGHAESLPFEDESFDIVLSRFSAHHWGDLGAGVREAARVLKPGGLAAFADTVSPGKPLLDSFLQTVEMLRDVSHVRDYSRAEWEASMAGAGLLAGTTRQFRLRLDFKSWIERIATPTVQADAIRALQKGISETVARHFAIEADGSFCIDVGLFEATRPEQPSASD